MKTVFRLKLIENNEMYNRIDCYEFEELKKFKLVINNEETGDDYPELFAVGNQIKLSNEGDIFTISKILTQNGPEEIYVDIDCKKRQTPKRINIVCKLFIRLVIKVKNLHKNNKIS